MAEEFLDALVDILVCILVLGDNRLGLGGEGHAVRLGDRGRGRKRVWILADEVLWYDLSWWRVCTAQERRSSQEESVVVKLGVAEEKLEKLECSGSVISVVHT